MDATHDLLGDQLERIVQRSAIFDGANRLVLSRRWMNGPIALVLGCNPSMAGANREDPTTRWLNAWFMRNWFGGYDLMNLYPFVTPSPAECRRAAEWESNGPDWYARDQLVSNRLMVAKAAKAAAKVFVCWGNIAWDPDWIHSVVADIQHDENPRPDLWCWGITASGAPKHPAARGVHRMTADTPAILWKAAP